MIKLLMVTRESHADKRYGLGKSLAPLIAELEQRGITVGYLCQADAGERSLAALRTLHHWSVKLFGRWFRDTEFVPLFWGLLERLNMGRLAAKVMARDHYTHVHCHDPIIAAGYRWFARLRWLAQFRRGHTARWGVTEHGFGCYAEAFHIDGARLGTGTMRWLRQWETKILLKAHWVMTPTSSGLSQLGRDLSIFPRPTTWHSIYHPRPQLNHYSKSEARQRLGWSSDTIYLIAVGRFAPLKQLPAVVQACASLPPLPRWKLVLIGEGDRTPLQRLAMDLGMVDQLLFAISDDMGLYYSAADIYVSTSLTESFGLANLEALVMDLPAICTAVGGVPEVVGSGAWLIPAQDNRVLAQVLQILVETPNVRQHWQRCAHQWVQSWPTVKHIADTYIAMYQGNPLPIFPPLSTSQPSPFREWHQQVNQWDPCPLPRPLELPSRAKILVIAPHSDDETLGCGGTLALLRQQGCQVTVVIMTDGAKGDPLGYLAENNHVVNHRQRESLAALQLLGIEEVIFLNQPDGHYQHTATVVQQLTTIMNNYAADWLFIPSVLDYHRDHVAICLSALDIWQSQGGRERVLLYETWGPLPATWVVNITSVFALKQQATRCYELPLKYCDYFTACSGMAGYRGLYFSQHQGQYAEAFLELDMTSWRAVLTYLLQIREYQERCLTACATPVLVHQLE